MEAFARCMNQTGMEMWALSLQKEDPLVMHQLFMPKTYTITPMALVETLT
jgi:hypothetical protein